MLLQKASTLSLDSIEKFRLSLLGKNRSLNTVKGYTTDLKVLLAETEETEIPAADFEDVAQNWLTANIQRVQPKTTTRRLTSLKQFAKWAGWGVMFDDYSAPTPLRGQPHPLPEGIDGVKRMIDAARKDEHKVLVALCGLFGMRIAEALAIKASDFDLEAMTVKIRGKGDKERLVPCSEYAWSVIAVQVTKSYCNGDTPLVGLKDRFARSVITTTAKRALLKRHVASHDLRATFATAVYDKTRDMRVVQILLGHASGETTEVYVGRSMAQMKDGVELL